MINLREIFKLPLATEKREKEMARISINSHEVIDEGALTHSLEISFNCPHSVHRLEEIATDLFAFLDGSDFEQHHPELLPRENHGHQDTEKECIPHKDLLEGGVEDDVRSYKILCPNDE
jgi:hypothetical protein